jgi:hypothetical protein
MNLYIYQFNFIKLSVFPFAERENISTNDALDSEVSYFSLFANF